METSKYIVGTAVKVSDESHLSKYCKMADFFVRFPFIIFPWLRHKIA